MAKKPKHEMQLTKGEFQIRGIVKGVNKDYFYAEKVTKNNQQMRFIKFGLEYASGKTIEVSLNGTAKEYVYFSKYNEDKTSNVEKVEFSKRTSFNKDGFKLLGIKLGLERNEKDNKNIIKTMVDFDAVEYMSTKLKDGMSVYVQGDIEPNHYSNSNGDIVRNLKFNIKNIFLCNEPIIFDNENFESKNDFKQTIIYKDVQKNNDYNNFDVQSHLVTYSNIEDVELTINDASLANIFKKNLKPYNSINVYGHIEAIENVIEVVDEDEDGWGAPDPTKSVRKPTKIKLVITGASPSTIDKELYSEEKIERGKQLLKREKITEEDYGDSSNQTEILEEDEDWD